ncbi:uncharacterized protein LOC112054539 [Bicyclus anynana]|uniref:Uncharacterized protein LOC112054539 n=1 Tax=Bicyclus anynana TaxID=110368 RepID=A0A6J1NZA2_BICAN|nr:uncharacterized protein LOC112054539 [Bicyclus anynana]
MNFTFLCLVICLCVLLFEVQARYNTDVLCVIEKDNVLYCIKSYMSSRRTNQDDNLPSHEPYFPTAKNGVFYNCSSLECRSVKIYSLIQLASPRAALKYCYQQPSESYQCEPVKYHYYKNIDKLLFLSNNIPNNIFYLIDCLAYGDGGRVCHKKDVDSHTKLVDIGNIARPNESNVLSQEELLCEQSENKINCDLNLYVPYSDGLRAKELIKTDNKILLKTETNIVVLNYNCLESWCGYSTLNQPTRRSHYEPPGGKMYRCYYAQRQQICKKMYGSPLNIYNQRDWLSS